MMLVLGIALMLAVVGEEAHPSYREQVLLNVSKPYHREDSPYDEMRHSVTLYIDARAVLLTSVNDIEETATYTVTIIRKWGDPRLVYNKTYFGEGGVVVPIRLLWEPVIHCSNCINVEEILKRDENEARIEPNGIVTSFWKARIVTICRGNTDRFPFDEKYSEINFVEAEMSAYRTSIVTDQFVEPEDVVGTQEWFIQPVDIERTSSKVGFKFLLKRSSTFYLFLIIFPSITTTTLVVAATILPATITNKEIYSYSISGIIALSFILNVVLSHVPKGTSVPLIGMLIILQMILCLSGLILHKPLGWLSDRVRTRITSKAFRRICVATLTVSNVVVCWLIYLF